jgi:hypothetical protein
MSAGLAGLAQSGLIEIAGALPEDDTEREEWELQGKTPYSVRIGDRWYSAAAYPGVAENVVMAGLMGDIQRKAQAKEARGEEVGLGDYGSATMDAALQYFGQTGIRPMFGGLANIIGAGTARSEGQRKYYIDQLTKQGVGQLAPASGLMRQIGNVTDRTQRAPEGAAENLAAIYPWWRENLPAKTNALGQEMQSEGSKWPLAGLFSSKEASDTVQRRKYLGSRSAAQDLEISRAIEAVNAYNKDRRANPKPTRAEVRMAAKFKGRLNPRRKAIDEKVKTREDRAAESRRRANAGGYGANPFEFQVPGLFRDLIGSEA